MIKITLEQFERKLFGGVDIWDLETSSDNYATRESFRGKHRDNSDILVQIDYAGFSSGEQHFDFSADYKERNVLKLSVHSGGKNKDEVGLANEIYNTLEKRIEVEGEEAIKKILGEEE